ncbi:MAG: hypothetical protein KDC95_10555 [Planctomycetes bacterium]|nr:hypothetical protein [Planctomycetota bacterium]
MRIGLIVLLIPTIAYGIGIALERLVFARRVAAQRWLPDVFRAPRVLDPELGIVGSPFEVDSRNAAVTPHGALTVVLHESLVARSPAERNADEEWLRRKLFEVDLAAVVPEIHCFPGTTAAQRARAIAGREASMIVFMITPEDVWLADEADGATRVRLQPGQDQGTLEFVAADEGAAQDSLRHIDERESSIERRLPSWIPLARVLTSDASRLVDSGDVSMPSWLLPWRREGSQGESAHYAPLERAMQWLATHRQRQPVLVVRLPATFEVADDRLTQLMTELELDPSHIESRRFERRVQDIVMSHGVDYLDLRSVLYDVERQEDASAYESMAVLAPVSERSRRVVLAAIARALRRSVAPR